MDVLEESQHVEVVFAPGSQSSPSSTIPSISPSVLCYITRRGELLTATLL